MEMSGERRIPAPRQQVWEALNDPEILRAAIPGCEAITRTGPEIFEARIAVRLGPMAAKFAGRVKLENINAPASYTISGEGTSTTMGFARGSADVVLEEIATNATLLRYSAKAQIGGKMAQLGARLLDSTARQLAEQFFDRFAAALAASAPAPAQAAPAAATAGAAAPPLSLFDLLPAAPFGVPLIAWAGGAIWLVILALLFL